MEKIFNFNLTYIKNGIEEIITLTATASKNNDNEYKITPYYKDIEPYQIEDALLKSEKFNNKNIRIRRHYPKIINKFAIVPCYYLTITQDNPKELI